MSDSGRRVCFSEMVMLRDYLIQAGKRWPAIRRAHWRAVRWLADALASQLRPGDYADNRLWGAIQDWQEIQTLEAAGSAIDEEGML
ncbi:MAG: hypothetical protein E6R03_02185 [Hyphomicrobiaceae bacterium]|nr:MAG: hypothetical protein E6R03_02185 [Hyphomicrobiaceae bacterium]